MLGRSAALMLQVRDAETDEMVPGCRLTITLALTGEDFTWAADPDTWYFSGYPRDADSAPAGTPRAPWGDYLASVEPPEGWLAPAEPTAFSFSEDSVGYIDIFVEPAPRAEKAAEAAAGGRRRAFRDALARKPWRAHRRRIVHFSYLAAAAAVAVAAAAFAGPSLYVACYALAALANHDLGARFCAGLFHFLLSQPSPLSASKAAALIKALGPSPALLGLSAAFTLGLAAWAQAALAKFAESKLPPPCELLDSLPEPADSNVHGNARIERSEKEIRRGLPNAAMRCGEEIPKGRFYVGVVDGPLPLAAAEDTRAAAWAAAQRFRRRGMFDPPPSVPVARNLMRYVHTPDFQNGILLGDTRAGKTRRDLYPSIDLLLESGTSIVLLDPKGEISNATSGYAAEKYGADCVHIINFRDPEDSDCSNPLKFVIAAARAADRGERARDIEGRVVGSYSALSTAANDMSKMLLPELYDVGNAKYFNTGGRSCISSAAIFTALSSTGCPADQMSLATVASIIDRYMRPIEKPGGKPGEMWVPYKEMLKRLPHDHPAVTAFGTAGAAKLNELQNFVTTALTALQDYRDAAIARITSRDSFKFEDLGRKPMVVYLVIPHEKQTYAAIASLYLQQAYQALIAEASRNGGRLGNEVTFLCEELGQLPPIPDLESKLTVSLGAGINWLLVFQSLSQVVTKYESNPAATLWANANYKNLLKTADVQVTGEWVRKQLGTYTVSSESSSKSRGPFSIMASSLSDSSQLVERDVMMSHEVAQWSADIGNLFMLNDKDAKAAYCVRMPDVSELPTGVALGLDGKSVAPLPVHPSSRRFEESQAWDPCLGTMDPKARYDEDDFRRIEAEFLAALLAGPQAPSASDRAVAYVKTDGTTLCGPFAVPDGPAEEAGFLRRARAAFPCGPGGEWWEVGEVRRNKQHIGWLASDEVRKRASDQMARFARKSGGARLPGAPDWAPEPAPSAVPAPAAADAEAPHAERRPKKFRRRSD